MTRLTDVERAERAMSERDFQRQVTDLAELLGWMWCHWRALRNGRGIWQVPVEGPLGKGWPDLTLVRARDRRLIFAELKRELEHLSPDQVDVINALRELDVPRGRDAASALVMAPFQLAPRIDVAVWRPSDLRDPIETSRIYEVLR
jgi:hypothetical protein